MALAQVRILAVYACWWMMQAPHADAATPSRLPADAESVLAHAHMSVLVSLEPWEQLAPGKQEFHGAYILGTTQLSEPKTQKAVAALQYAAKAGRLIALCFEPRQALVIKNGEDTYDFVICYSCATLAVFKNNVLQAEIPVGGSPDVLNALLLDAKIPLSKSADIERDAERVQLEKSIIDRKRWLDALPEALRPLWIDNDFQDTWGNRSHFTAPAGKILDAKGIDKTQVILALLHWYGSGAGPWSGYPAYEDDVAELLMHYSTDEIVAALQNAVQSDSVIEGAARFFARWTFGRTRAAELALIPSQLKQTLLRHTVRGGDVDKIGRAKKAFAG